MDNLLFGILIGVNIGILIGLFLKIGWVVKIFLQETEGKNEKERNNTFNKRTA